MVPFLLTMLMGSGLQQFNYMSDVFYLFVPVHAKSIQDHSRLQELFPENMTSHTRGSELRFHQLVDLIIVPLEGKSALSREVWEEVALVAEAASNISVYSEGRVVTWTDLCVKFDGKCVDNTFLDLLSSTNISSDVMDNLTYPVMMDTVTDELYPLMAHLGGVELEDDAVTQAGALRLSFMLDDSSRSLKKASLMWSNALEHFIHKIKLKTSTVSCFNVNNVERELVDNIQTAFEENLPLVVVLVASFTIMNCMSTDWVRAKPMMGVVGLLCVILSAISGFGLSLYLGFPWQAINVVVVFLLIGIGMDGVFLMLSAWSRSELVSRDLVTRMSITYSDASISLTITSLTNVLSFLVGATVPGFPCVQIFCVYAGTSLMFNYFWILTLFGAFLAISGHMEHSNRHCLLLTKVKSKTVADQSGFLYKVFLAGGISPTDPDNPRDNKDEKIMLFFKDVVTPCLNFIPMKILIIISFGLYLAVAILGILGMEEGLELQNLAMKTSNIIPHFSAEGKYFRDHPFRIQIAIIEELDYHNKDVQEQVMTLISELEESKYITNNPKFRQSWLHEFLTITEENFLIFNITTKDQFRTNLILFLEEADQLSSDVKFNDGATEVEASRFFLQSERIDNPQTEMLMMVQLRKILSNYPFDVIAFNPNFYMFDQFLEVFDNTIFCVLLCGIIMSLVILIFIPNKMCVIWVTVTVMSVEVGVVGLMSFWGIKLDVISMIVLIMGIGFSVDFSAHVSYHYLAAEDGSTSAERLAHCLYALGPPILQGAATTILSVLPLLRHQSYIIHTFSKMIFLVIFLGLLHSLLLLPVLLTIFGPSSSDKAKKKVSSVSNLLSPSNTTSLSDTFIYKAGADNCLVKQALTGDAKRRRHIPSVNLVKKNFNNESDCEEESRKVSPSYNLHLSFFQPSESDTSDIVTQEENTFRGRANRAHSDSSYYSYQKRHLRRHMKPVPIVPIRQHSVRGRKDGHDCKQAFPSKLESIKHSLKHANTKYECFAPGKEGSENQGFNDSEVGNTSGVSTFRPKGSQDLKSSNKQGLKIVFVEHEDPVSVNDESEESKSDGESESFEEVELNDQKVQD